MLSARNDNRDILLRQRIPIKRFTRILSQQNMSIVVPAGQQMSLTLPDNSQVQLNSGTRLEYPVVFGKTRSVKLSGEALFDVAPDRKHPFIVQTFASDIRVLGTKFNVLADAERGEFTTTLIEGQVQVTNRANSNERITMYPHDVSHSLTGACIKNVPKILQNSAGRKG